MYDFVYAVFKVGDQPGEEGIKDGMLVDIIDPNEYNPEISDHMKKVFSILKLPYSMIEKLKASLVETRDISDTKSVIPYYPRLSYVDFKEIETLLGKVDYETDLRSTKVVEIQDAKTFPDTILRDTTKIVAKEEMTDINAIAEGNFTVGSTGSYATWAAAFSDLANLSGNLTLTQISNTTETAGVSSTIVTTGYILTITSNYPHVGNPTKGWITEINHIGNGFNMNFTGTGTIIINNLYLNRTTAANPTGRYCISWGGTANVTIYFHDILIDGKGLAGSGWGPIGSNRIHICWNITIWDCGLNGYDGSGVAQTYAHTYENITVYNCGNIGFRSFAAYTNATFRNCVSINNVTADFAGTTNSTGRNNASSDTTAQDANWLAGTGNLTSITPANEFVSLTDTDPNFLRVKLGGSLDDGGTAITITGNNTRGIRGNARPRKKDGSLVYSIGADQIGYGRLWVRQGSVQNTDQFVAHDFN